MNTINTNRTKWKREFYIRSPLEKDKEEICDLLSKVFSKSWGYYEFFNFCKNNYLYKSNYDAETSKIGLIKNKIVTFCGVMNYKINIGSSSVKTAGVGGVATDANYRKQGLMHLTMQETIKAMELKGYQLSLLYGIANYYKKFGYITAWAIDNYAVPASRFVNKKTNIVLEKLRDDSDIPDDFALLYNNQYGTLTGTAVHPTYRRNRFPGKWEIYYWKNNSSKRTEGYVIVEFTGNSLNCIETCGDTDKIWDVLGKLIDRKNIKELYFPNLHYLSTLAERIRKGSYTLERIQEYNAGPMARLINLNSILKEIIPVLSNRLNNSEFAKWKGKLNISNGREHSMLVINKSEVKVVESTKNINAGRIWGGEEIVQLIIGSADPTEIARNSGIVLTGDAGKLINVLFPRQFPTLSKWDKF